MPMNLTKEICVTQAHVKFWLQATEELRWTPLQEILPI